jgi:hypothetical protein
MEWSAVVVLRITDQGFVVAKRTSKGVALFMKKAGWQLENMRRLNKITKSGTYTA